MQRPHMHSTFDLQIDWLNNCQCVSAFLSCFFFLALVYLGSALICLNLKCQKFSALPVQMQESSAHPVGSPINI